MSSYPTNTYPTVIQTTNDPIGSDDTSTFDHAGLESFQNDSILALKNKVGSGASTPAANKILKGNGTGTSTWGQVTEDEIDLSDNTTNDVTTSQHGFVPKLPNDDSKFLDGKGNYSVPSSSTLPPIMTLTTNFETAARFTGTTVNTGAQTFATNGLAIATGASATSSQTTDWSIDSGNDDISSGSPTFSVHINMTTTGSDFNFFVGIGIPTTNGSSITLTDKMIGLLITRASSGLINYGGISANGVSTTTSAAAGTMVAGDSLELIFRMTSSTNIAFYTRKNGGTLSVVSNVTTNIPSSIANKIRTAITNMGVASASIVQVTGISYSR